VQQLAEAEIAGVDTEIRNQMPKSITVIAVTAENACSGVTTPDIFKKQVTEYNAGLVNCASSCREVDGTAEYTMDCPTATGLTDVQVKDLADGVAGAMTPATGGRLLSSERRLSTVKIQEIGATQSTEECPTTSSNCGTESTKAASETTKAGTEGTKAGSETTKIAAPESSSSSGSTLAAPGSLLAFGLVTFIVSMV